MSENQIVVGMQELLAELEKPKSKLDKNIARSKVFQLASQIENAKEIPSEAFAILPLEMQQATLTLMLGIASQTLGD